jgi:exopolyphosphatase/guanosine-5'-triphosphate,3'-diphosphate pyrophosphatase
LQLADVHQGAPPLPTHAVREPTLLGESFEPDGSIDAAGVEQVVTAVTRAMRAARQYGVEELYVFATAAVRDATNRELIVARVEREAGVRPQFLAGEDEARLTYLAVRQWYGWSAARLLVLDIGGGSMEIILGRDAEPELSVSLPLGAGKLTRDFLPDDPPSRAQLGELRQHVRDTLREIADRLRWEGAPDKAIATSKTFKQLARLAGAPAQRKGPFVRRSLTIDDLATWIPRLAAIKASQRAKLRGVSRPRSRQIVAGALVARTAMKTLDVPSVDVCPWALREGIVLHYLQTRYNRSLAMPLHPLHRLTEQAARARLADDQREDPAGAGQPDDDPGHVVVDDPALEPAGSDGDPFAGLIPRQQRQPPPVKGEPGEDQRAGDGAGPGEQVSKPEPDWLRGV